jgi:hypothetical protein
LLLLKILQLHHHSSSDYNPKLTTII